MTDLATMQDDRTKADGVKLTPLQAKRRRQRNIAIGLALFGFVVLFYIVTLIKLGTGPHH